jgi:RNA polymerase sigma factor for flagellar operon FliA
VSLTLDEAKDVYSSELERIERILGFTCRRNALSPDDAEEFRSDTHLRLIEDDYRLLREASDPSTVGSFLVVVVQRLLLDFRVRRWGKWRPSVAARSAGEVGVRLETLVVRDGVDFGEACEILRRNHGVTQSRDDLDSLLQTFPVRRGLASQRTVALDEQATPRSSEDPDDTMADSLRAGTEEALTACLRKRVGELSAEDRLVLRMVYIDGQPVSVVSRALGLEQRPLYRRLEKLQRALREALEQEGVTRERFRDLVESRRGLQLVELAGILGPSPSSGIRGPAREGPEKTP